MSDDEDALRAAILDSYKVVCICNKIRKGVIEKAIRSGARTLDDIRRRTRACTGPCTPNRCGPVIKEMLAKANAGGSGSAGPNSAGPNSAGPNSAGPNSSG